MQVIRVISGDNELSALDFQKHYKMPVVHLLDTDRAFERKHNKDGWPFLMLVDSEGQIIYKCNNLIDREKDLLDLLEKLKEKSVSSETKNVNGVTYMTSTLQQSDNRQLVQNERFTSMAAGHDGEIYCVFTSVKDGNSDVIMRMFNGESYNREIPVAATDADEYDGTVLVDNDKNVWVCWTSNAVDNKYQINLTSLNNIREGKKALIISQSRQDSMHGRMAADESGDIWITYYQWHNIGNTSRDKEVYLCRFSNGSFSKEIRISPTDVSEYEDHTDPTVSVLGNQVYVGWSWDFHQPKGYTKDAREPTIFARTVGRDLKLGKIFHISAHKIDSMPMLSRAHEGNLWCAWDSLGANSRSQPYRKILYVRSLENDAAGGNEIAIADNLVNVCGPCFAFYEDKGVLTWAQTENGKDWSLWKSEFDSQNNRWKEPSQVTSEANPRFASCVYDSGGKLWIAYSARTDKGREVVVKRLD